MGRGVGKRGKNTVGQAREKTSERGNRRKGRGRKYMKLGKGEWGAGDREERTERGTEHSRKNHRTELQNRITEQNYGTEFRNRISEQISEQNFRTEFQNRNAEQNLPESEFQSRTVKQNLLTGFQNTK